MSRSLARGILIATAMAFSFVRLLAQTSTWISPGPAGPGINWNDPSGWDTGVVPNSPGAVAIFDAFYFVGQSQLTTLPGTQKAVITSAVTVDELRYLPTNPGTVLTPAAIDVTTGGQLRIEGAGITKAGGGEMLASILVRNGGVLEFANSASATGPSSSVTITGGAYFRNETPGSIIFRDQSSSGFARIVLPEDNTLTFLDRSSAGRSVIVSIGSIRFSGTSTAESASISTSTSLIFEDQASAGTARLTAGFGTLSNGNNTAGKIFFKDQASGDGATIIFQTDVSILDLSGMAAPPAAGSTGRVLLANPNNPNLGVGIIPNDAGTISIGGFERIPSAAATAILLGGTRLIVGGNNHDIIDLPQIRELGGSYGSAAGERLVGGGLTKRGTGLLQISQNNLYSGQTVLEQGELRLVGRIPTTLVLPAGRLTGIGTIVGDLPNAGLVTPGLPSGYLVPGSGAPNILLVTLRNPIGSLKVEGNYQQQPGFNNLGARSRLAIEIAGQNEFDRLVVSGSASLGGQLELSLLNGYVPVGTTSYSFLSATSVSGTFEQIVFGSGWGYLLDPQLVYGSTGVTLTVHERSLAALGSTAAEQALGLHLEQTLGSSTGEYRTLIVTLNGLPSASEVTSALRALSPDRYGALPEQGFTAALTQQSALDHHLASWRESSARTGLELYFDASYRRSVFSRAEGLPESRFETSGGLAGGAWRNGRWTAGAAIGYDTTTAKLDSTDSKADVKSIRPEVFLQYAADAFFLNASAGFSYDDYELSRRIAFTGFDQTAMASPSGHRADVSITGGYNLPAGAWRIIPNTGFLYSAWKINDFSETGAAGAAMAFSDWSNGSSRSRAGIELSRQSSRGRLVPRVSLLWWHEFNEDRAFGARFAGANARYIAPGRAATQDLLQGKLSLEAEVGGSAVFSASVEGLWGAQLRTEPGFSAGMRWVF